MMMRMLAILIFLLAGLPRVGIGMIGAPAGHNCAEIMCQQQVIDPVGCCDEPEPIVDMDEYCPMSDGECRCGVAPDDHAPSPKVPLQRSDTRMMLGFAKASVELPKWSPSADACSIVEIDLVVGLASLRTHNETQALLGIWRT